jgi:predicted transcriptional regulator of viral defense system
MKDSVAHLPAGRSALSAVLAAAKDVVRIEDAQTVLGLDRAQAAKMLSRWMKQGWLRRVGPGTYVPVPVEMLDAGQVVEDPWILVPALFEPAYVGGRTAAEHWDLTEQIFRDIVVFTGRPVRRSSFEMQGAVFLLRHIETSLIFGTKTVWRGRSRVAVSDVHRTLIDMLAEPAIGGGIQHVVDCLAAYFKREDRKDDVLLAYAERLGNGAVYKRLGFLAESEPSAAVLVAHCSKRLTKGHAKLDPSLDCKRLVTRWRLRVPQNCNLVASDDR